MVLGAAALTVVGELAFAIVVAAPPSAAAPTDVLDAGAADPVDGTVVSTASVDPGLVDAMGSAVVVDALVDAVVLTASKATVAGATVWSSPPHAAKATVARRHTARRPRGRCEGIMG
jgi:hypothetical protein